MLTTEHLYLKDDKTKKTNIVPPDPYLWLTENGEHIYFQCEKFYRGLGEPELPYNEVPQWFWNTVKRIYPKEYLDKFKLVFPEDRVLTKEEKDRNKIADATKLIECDICHKMVEKAVFGLHKAHHASAEKRKNVAIDKTVKEIASV